MAGTCDLGSIRLTTKEELELARLQLKAAEAHYEVMKKRYEDMVNQKASSVFDKQPFKGQ